MDDPRSLLVIRHDNIGDLVCTTPLISALRTRFPKAWIGAHVNSYNAPVLDGNPDLDAVIAYTKLKHREAHTSAFRALTARVQDLWRLRDKQLDCVVIASPSPQPRTLRLARVLAPRSIVSHGGTPAQANDDARHVHEVLAVFALAREFGIRGAPPPLCVVPDPGEVERVRHAAPAQRPLVAVHLSARRPAQRWRVERYAELIHALHRVHGAAIVLLWSPGAANHPRHPGDDDKARALLDLVGSDAPLYPCATAHLAQLIGALAACDAVICPDGGAMHLAAALGKPVVALFGDSPPERWYPWGVAHRVVRPESRDLADLQVAEVLEAYAALMPR